MQKEQAELMAVNALGWLAGNDDLFPVFLNSSGVSIDEVRKRANEPVFLASVLDFILMDDAWVLECAQVLNLAPDALGIARQSLPGGQTTHWT